jgi:hypothetical protein
MQEANTQHASTSPLDDGQRDLRRRRRRTWAAGLVAAAAAAVALVAWVLGPGLLNREESIEPAQTPTPAEEVAYGFLDAYASADNPRVASYLAEDAFTEIWAPRERVWRTAAGYRMLNESCEQQSTTPDGGGRVECAFDYHMLGSEERDQGPFSGDHITFIVKNNKIAAATEVETWATNGFSDQAWEPFASWVAVYHPEDAAVMYDDWPQQGGATLTDRSLALWERHVQEYANQNP